MMPRPLIRNIAVAQFVAFIFFMNVTGYWHCGEKTCGYWVFKNCCEHPKSAHDHDEAADDFGGYAAIESDHGCAFSSSFERSYATEAALTLTAPTLAILPTPQLDVVLLHNGRTSRFVDGRGPPGPIQSAFPHSLRAPPLS